MSNCNVIGIMLSRLNIKMGKLWEFFLKSIQCREDLMIKYFLRIFVNCRDDL